jgi:hypothetical protein
VRAACQQLGAQGCGGGFALPVAGGDCPALFGQFQYNRSANPAHPSGDQGHPRILFVFLHRCSQMVLGSRLGLPEASERETGSISKFHDPAAGMLWIISSDT